MVIDKWDQKEIIRYHKQTKRKYSGEIIAQELIKLVKKYIGKSVLDVGAGNGALINQIPNAKGMDLVPKNKSITKAGIEAIPFKDKSFDTMFCTDVLEHLNDKILNQGLKEVYRVLKSDGYFIITVPYDEDLEANKIFCPKCGSHFHRVGHMRSFNKNKMKKLLEKNNFKIVFNQGVPLSYYARFPYLKIAFKILSNFDVIKNKKLVTIVKK